MTKYLIKGIIGILLCLFASSCSSLQYRHTDLEIKQDFSAENKSVIINYYDDEDSGLRIRSIHTKKPDNTVNLVFLHGSPSSLSAWSHYVKDSTLLSKANLYAIDRPGYGYSGFGKALVSIEDQGEVMSNLINHYQLDNVIVVGTSYGGPLAARIAAINKNIKAVMMVSPAIDPEQEKYIWQSKFTQWWLTRWLVPTGYRVAGDEKTTHAVELKKLEKDWDNVTVPVVHIHGDTDDIVPFGNINYSKKVFKNIEVIEIRDKGHEIAWRNPEIVMPYLFQLIEKISK